MKYIATISFGKDSTVMCDLLLKNGYPVDYIVFTDTMLEFPMMYKYKEKVVKYFKDRYNKDVITTKPEKSFEYWCYGKIQSGEMARITWFCVNLEDRSEIRVNSKFVISVEFI